jgi:hypothetical protein
VDGVILTERWRRDSDVDRIAPAIAWFKDHHIAVIAVGPVQEYDVPLPMLLAFAIKRHDATLPERHIVPDLFQVDQLLQARTAQWQVPYLSPLQALCHGGHCTEYVDPHGEVPTLADSNHLTNEASALIAEEWAAKGFFAGNPLPKERPATPSLLSSETLLPNAMLPVQRPIIGDLRSRTINPLAIGVNKVGQR